MNYRILAINPGSTSTKISVYENENELITTTLNHSADEISQYLHIQDQFPMRKKAVLEFLSENGYDISDFSGIVGRGGLLPPVKSGAYEVNDLMIDTLMNRPYVEHASNLGAIIAYDIAKELGIKAYIYDSVRVDELQNLARISGMPEIPRESSVHALNSRAMAMKAAKLKGKRYEESNFVVAHLGGGITLSAHNNGKMIDIVSDDEGPFSPERSGRVPCNSLVKLCYSGKYDQKSMVKQLRGKGGLVAYLGTVDAREVEKMIENGDENARLVYEAMAYQIAKGVGEMATVLFGKVDGIILTGGISYSKMLTSWIKERVEFIGEVIILPGENEMESLSLGTLRVLRGEEVAREYTEE
ncbi:MAG: butyrate kinase [Filifactoraceae bacterium]